ncbi:MAG TPA: TRAP transporter small permease subunit [Rhodocyclaceae bacterium]|nr:TRAP transporter small permease subunit [Rhodocyclaceae bacterium]
MTLATGENSADGRHRPPASPLRWLEGFDRVVNRVLTAVAGFALVGMLFFAVGDIALRSLGRPVAGSYEVIGWLSAAAMALVLGSVQQQRGHVSVKLLESRLGPRSHATVELFNSLLSLLLFAAVAWYVARYGRVLQQTGSLSETLRVIVYPWVYLVALGSVGLAFALLIDFLRAAGRLAALLRRT